MGEFANKLIQHCSVAALFIFLTPWLLRNKTIPNLKNSLIMNEAFLHFSRQKESVFIKQKSKICVTFFCKVDWKKLKKILHLVIATKLTTISLMIQIGKKSQIILSEGFQISTYTEYKTTSPFLLNQNYHTPSPCKYWYQVSEI